MGVELSVPVLRKYEGLVNALLFPFSPMANNSADNNQETRPATRQELYDRIRQTSKEEFILNDMIRLGFWERNAAEPSVPEQIIRRETELGQELRALLTEKRRVEDQQALLKEMRKERFAESRRKREENKLRREQERKDRAENWRKRKETEIIYLGENVSGGLNHIESDAPKLGLRQLPLLTDAVSVAAAMQIPIGQLRFLAFSRQVSKTTHYKRFLIPKKTGGQRRISAPMARLKTAQTWILQHILEPISIHESAHGFVAARSIVSNALPHVGAEVVINMDFKDFFPSITYPRVKGVFQSLGYSENVATILALICTESAVDIAELDGETWYIASGQRFLPQGSPASPAITNVLCAKLDKRLNGLAKKFGFTYTRYADDLTFSASGEGTKQINNLTRSVRKIVEDEGLTVHPDKTRIMRKGSRKEVTGIIVNDKPGVDRKSLRKFRALLHQLEKEGAAGKTWGNPSADLLSSMEGYANFVKMVDAEKGQKLKAQVEAIVRKLEPTLPKRVRKSYPKKQPPVAYPGTNTTQAPTDAPKEPPGKAWWKMWK